MIRERLLQLGHLLLIAAEVMFITFLNYAMDHYWPFQPERHLSLDILYCLPIIQTAKLTALRTMRRNDTQVSTYAGVVLALVISLTEAALFWPVPVTMLALNIFTRSVMFTVIGRVIVKLWREREYARKDMLTGLYNRIEFVERFTAEQERSARTNKPYSVLFIDIDQFKMLNDEYGHHVGDEALKLLADLLRNGTRKLDIISRLGGDEFIVLLPNTDEHSRDILVRRIQAEADRMFSGRLWPISLSIGRITDTGRSKNVDWIIRMADENMYETKKAKRNGDEVNQ